MASGSISGRFSAGAMPGCCRCGAAAPSVSASEGRWRPPSARRRWTISRCGARGVRRGARSGWCERAGLCCTTSSGVRESVSRQAIGGGPPPDVVPVRREPRRGGP
eukprot:782473-Lingulodinium_polyedra.AAC.1